MVGINPLQRHTVDSIVILKKFIVGEFIMNEYYDQDTTRDPHCQTQNIDQSINLLLKEVSNGKFNVVLVHGCLVVWLLVLGLLGKWLLGY